MTLTLTTARVALRRAMEVRKRNGVPMDHEICPYDIAQLMGIEVWFQPLPSLAGMYSGPTDPSIIIGSDRPAGYQASTCAHEIGHHAFGHGTRVDQYIQGIGRPRSTDPEERLADMFGAHLTMPQAAVSRAFTCRSWDPARSSPEQVFVVAGHLGVGYQTLVHHLRWTLEFIDSERFERLMRPKPKAIRTSLLGKETAGNVVIVDTAWSDRAVDLVVGDIIILPPDSRLEGTAVRTVGAESSRTVAVASRRGVARAERQGDDWSAFIRVMPPKHEGAAIHRHLEDPDAP